MPMWVMQFQSVVFMYNEVRYYVDPYIEIGTIGGIMV